jgi:predicted O-methyltransferase YrrM
VIRTAAECRDAWKYLQIEELEALQEIARSLPRAGHVINIGAGAGTSALAFLEARSDLRVTTIDLRMEPSPLGSLASEAIVLQEAGYWGEGRYRQIHGSSPDVGQFWSEGPVDLVFVDGDHSYQGCRADLEAWKPHVLPAGYLLLHDFGSAVWPEVETAAADVLDPDPDFDRLSLVATLAIYRRRS